MVFLRGQRALISRQDAEAFKTSRVVTILDIDYDDSIYPYRVEFSDGTHRWIKKEALRPIKGNCAKVV